jgi:hypothetical protein
MAVKTILCIPPRRRRKGKTHMTSRQASKKSDADVGHLDYGLDVAQKVFQELQSEESEIVFGGLERPRGFQVRSRPRWVTHCSQNVWRVVVTAWLEIGSISETDCLQRETCFGRDYIQVNTQKPDKLLPEWNDNRTSWRWSNVTNSSWMECLAMARVLFSASGWFPQLPPFWCPLPSCLAGSEPEE